MKIILNLFLLIFAGILFSSCDKVVYTGVVESSSEASENSTIVISSDPSGSVIFIDGKNSGFSTPDSIPWLAAGQHKIMLRNYLFDDTLLFVSLSNNRVIRVSVNYYINPGNFATIKCNSLPQGAAIFVNDSATGKVTPYTFTHMYPGDYLVKYTYPEHRADSVAFFVKGGHQFSPNLTLDDTSQVVDYRVYNSPIASNFINDVAVDNNGIVWAASADKGLLRFDGINWTIYDSDNSELPYSSINCVLFDNDRGILIGTSGGLTIFNNGSWNTFNKSNSNLPNNYVSSIARDNNGNLWIGTQGGLAKLSGGIITPYTTQNSKIASNIVSSVAVFGNYIYAGTGAGISQFDGTNWVTYNKYNAEILGNTVSALCADSKGNIYAGIVQNLKSGEMGGLFYFNGSDWTEIPTISGIGIKTTYCDRNDIVWVGTQGGMMKVENFIPTKLFTTSTTPALTINSVRGIVFTNKNQLWVSTYGGGLQKFKEGSY